MNMLDNKDRLGGLLLLIFSLFYLRYIFDIPLDPIAGDEFFTARTLPKGLAVLAIICSLIQLLTSANGGSISASVAKFYWQPVLLLTLLMLVYSLVFNFLGFVVATFLFLLFGFLVLGEKRLWLSGSVAGGLVLFMWAVLTQLFDLYLEAGTLFRLVSGGT